MIWQGYEWDDWYCYGLMGRKGGVGEGKGGGEGKGKGEGEGEGRESDQYSVLHFITISTSYNLISYSL